MPRVSSKVRTWLITGSLQTLLLPDLLWISLMINSPAPVRSVKRKQCKERCYENKNKNQSAAAPAPQTERTGKRERQLIGHFPRDPVFIYWGLWGSASRRMPFHAYSRALISRLFMWTEAVCFPAADTRPWFPPAPHILSLPWECRQIHTEILTSFRGIISSLM